MLTSFLKHLPNFHRNGKVKETQVSKKEDSCEKAPLIEVVEQEELVGEEESSPDLLKDFLDAKSWDVQDVTSSKDPLFDLVRVVTEIEELVVQTYTRIIKAQVEFKTGKDGTRYLQVHFALDRNMKKNPLARLKRQVIAKVALRVDDRQIKVVALEMKDTPKNDSNDPSS